MEKDNIKIGDVFFADIQTNGTVQGGNRPHIVLQNDLGNKFSPNVVLIPLTTALKKSKMPTHVLLPKGETGLPRDSIALCENPISFPKNKLGKYITSLPGKYMIEIAKANTLASSSISFLNLEDLIAV
jgi:mRNA interferase MazF